MRWFRYQAVIVGRHTLTRRSLPFVRFRHRDQGQRWCNDMNAANNHFGMRLTWYEVEKIL